MTRQQDPERALEPLIRQVVRSAAAAPAASASCLDPERLAAWADGGLRADETAALEAHAADCARCRAMLAAFGRAGDGLPTAAPATAPFWGRLRWKLLVPVAATAAALALYVATPEPPPATAPLSSRADQALAVIEPESPAAAEPVTGAAAARAVRAPSERTKSPDAGTPESRLQAQAKTTVGAVADLAGTAAASQAREQEAAPSTVGPAQTPSPGLEQGRLRETAAESAEARRGDVSAREAPPSAARAGASALNEAPALRDVRSAPVVRLLVVGGEAERWRVDGDRLEHRDDSGAWEAVLLPSQVPASSLMAGRRVNGAVWLVGRAGTVLISPNGTTFVLVAPPAPVDLSAVDAQDARAATVSAVDGRRFTTVDGGQTWHPE